MLASTLSEGLVIFMKRNVFLSFFLALSLSLSAPAFAADATLWYAEAQAYVTENALMTGTGHGFEPDATVTTATVLQTLYNLEGQPAVSHDYGNREYLSDGMYQGIRH